MLLLLDENLPKKLKHHFPGHQVFTIKELGWMGLKNRLLLQNYWKISSIHLSLTTKIFSIKKYPITIFVLSARINKYSVLTNLSPKILDLLNGPLNCWAGRNKINYVYPFKVLL